MSCHLQRLPGTNIKRAQVGGKVVGQKDPGAADFGTGNTTNFGPATQFLGMKSEESGGLDEPKGAWPVNHRRWHAGKPPPHQRL
jgi:hypothetical protein